MPSSSGNVQTHIYKHGVFQTYIIIFFVDNSPWNKKSLGKDPIQTCQFKYMKENNKTQL